jgi:hypothetical protein
MDVSFVGHNDDGRVTCVEILSGNIYDFDRSFLMMFVSGLITLLCFISV